MRIYFLVEGRSCERKLYPAWLSHLAPRLTRALDLDEAAANPDCYYLISGEGYPSILDIHLPNAVSDIERAKCFDVLVVVVDADEDSYADRRNAVIAAAARCATPLTSARLEVVVQNRCMETWLLGNRRAFARNPTSPTLIAYVRHYNVLRYDPELMPPLSGFNTHAQFHHAYLRAIVEEKRMSYSKSRPGDAAKAQYVDELKRRITETPTHLDSFARFLALCSSFAI